ncbi:hypothetical protein GOBAR_AA32462 [Gossypium barbadense]|uniref:Uncharacterized protein n=1 Tax=Gossypium barbadense TaxID=3634 RepID=A0A2P5WAY3_GOSBA|nr:hypothetical protein GOBAR_AA32462 [Gossypium barbadense]
MKLPHELDEKVVVAESVGPRAMGDIIRNVLIGLLLSRLGETILGRVGSSVLLDHPHAKHARDALWRHLADGKIACKYLRDGGRTDALERIGLYEAMLGAKVCQHFEGEKCMWRLRACSFSSLNSPYISLVQHQTLGRLAGELILLGEIEPCRDHRTSSLRSKDGMLSIVPS